MSVFNQSITDNKVEEYQETVNNDLALVNANITSLENGISNNTSAITVLQSTSLVASDLISIEADIASNGSSINTNASAISTLQATSLVASDLTPLETDIVNNTTAINTNTTQLSTLRTDGNVLLGTSIAPSLTGGALNNVMIGDTVATTHGGGDNNVYIGVNGAQGFGNLSNGISIGPNCTDGYSITQGHTICIGTRAAQPLIHARHGGGNNSRYWAPGRDNGVLLGNPNNRWRTIYAANGTINTSDRRLKENITTMPIGLDFVLALDPKRYKFKDRHVQDIVDENGSIVVSGEESEYLRNHYGFMAQDVYELLRKNEIDPATEGVWCCDDLDANANDTDLTMENGMRCREGIRYTEMIAILWKAVQELSARVDELSR